MSTDVARAVQFANPLTGEILTLTSPTEELSGWLSDVREYESVIRENKGIVNRELLARLDKGAKWTQHLTGGLTLSAPSPFTVEYDAEPLYWALQEVLNAGEITQEAFDAAVEQIVDYKVKATGVKALAKASQRLRDLIAEFSHEVERENRYASVKKGS